MYKLSAAILVALFVASWGAAALAQDAGDQSPGFQSANYQSVAPSWPQQAPQGYEQPQYDAYRGEAHMQNASSGNNFNQSGANGSDSVSRAPEEASKMTHANDAPIKPEGGKFKGAVGGLRRAVGHVAGPMSRVALPVAGMGAMYMVQRAAMRSSMMGGYGNGYGYPGGGYGYGMPMGYSGGGYGGYGMRGLGW